MAFDDGVVVAVKRADGRSCSSVALRVVLTAVTRTTEATGGEHRNQRDQLTAAFASLLARTQHRAVRLNGAAEMRAAVRDDREARLAVEKSVVADIRRATRHLSELWIDEEVGDEPLSFGEVGDQTEIDAVLPLLPERRAERHYERWYRDDRPDHAAEAERRAFEKSAAWEALADPRRGHCRLTFLRGNRGCRFDRRGGPPFGLDGRRQVRDGDRAPDRCDEERAHDQPDEHAGDPRGEPDRVEGRSGKVGPVPVFRLH